jgi:hypothetical protein
MCFGIMPQYTAGLGMSPETGPEGRSVADRLRARYGIPFEGALGTELATLGVLTAAEGAWLDDADTV